MIHKTVLIVLGLIILFLMGVIVHGQPTPSAPQNAQPNCMAGAFAILSVEVMNTNIPSSVWESHMSISNKMVIAMDGIHVWESQFPSNKFEIVYAYNDTNEYPVPYDSPLLWIGTVPEGNHAAVAYIGKTNAVIKHFVYNPFTHTNYCETLTYDKFFERTLFIFKVQH